MWLNDTATTQTRKKNNTTTYKPEYQLTDFLDSRESKDVYEVLMSKFAQSLVGSREWKNKINKTKDQINDLVTVSDEAYLLLLLENNWSCWVELNNIMGNEYTPSKNKVPLQHKPKYTYVSKSGVNHNQHGWSGEGIKRYNVLFELVNMARENHPEVDKHWLDKIKQTVGTRKRKAAEPIPKAMSLWDIDNTNDEAVSDSSSNEED